MLDYPKNRIYAIIPKAKVKSLIGDVLEVVRKSIDENFIVWDFPMQDKKVKELKKDSDIKLYSHDQILEVMASKEWSRSLNLNEQ